MDDIYRRDSFSDRVCGDLSEVILQYLPIEIKFKFECVSKQFQRTVFQRHHDLDINEIRINSRKEPKAYESLLTKLSNIRSLEQKSNNYFNFLNKSDIDLIVKCCNNFVEIHCDFYDVFKKTNDMFIEKFGSKIESIFARTYGLGHFSDIPKIFPNIKEISYISPNWNDTKVRHFGYEDYMLCPKDVLHLKNLMKISITLRNDLNENHFEEKVKDLQHLLKATKRSHIS